MPLNERAAKAEQVFRGAAHIVFALSIFVLIVWSAHRLADTYLGQVPLHENQTVEVQQCFL